MVKISHLFHLCGLLSTALLASLSATATVPAFGEKGISDYGLNGTELTVLPQLQPQSNRILKEAPATGSPITEAPEGKYVPCYVDYSMCWFQAAGGGGLAGFPLMGKPMHYIVTDEDEVYLYNPVFLRPFDGDNMQLGTYIRGTLSGNTVTFRFPQPMGEIDVYADGTSIEMAYANKMVTSVDEEGNSIYVPAEDENNYLTYTIDDNGNIAMDGMTEAYSDILGLSTAAGLWTGYGTWQWNANVLDPTPLTPPADLDITKWTFKDDMYGTVFVNVGIDGSDVWIQGISRTYLPEAWTKGTIEGNTVVFPRCEYIGEATTVGEYAWLAGSLFDEDVEYNDEGVASVSPNTLFDLVFEANEDFTVLTAKKKVVVNPNTKIYYALESYNHVVITQLPADFEPLPQPASITSFDVYEDGKADLWFKFNRNTADGIPLETDRLFYEIYTPDGTLYTFTPEVYPALEEEMTLIPRSTFISGVFMTQGSNINVKLDIPDIDNIGVRTIYISDGERYEAEITYSTPSGIGTFIADHNVTYEYYTLTGHKVTNPEKGCFIKVTRFNDGTRKAEKVII